VNTVICTKCGSTGWPRRKNPGSFAVTILLLLFFIIPGLIYEAWRIFSTYKVCKLCGSRDIIPADSPLGKKIAANLKTTLLILIIGLSAFGCAGLPPIEKQSAAEIAARTTFYRDNFKKVSSVDGEKFGVFLYNGVDDFEAWLHAEKQDGKETVFALLVKTTRGNSYGWAFWGEAFDKDGANLNVEKIASEVGDGGVTYELIGVHMVHSYLESHRASGIFLRIDGKRAQKVINVPANYIDGFLNKASASGI